MRSLILLLAPLTACAPIDPKIGFGDDTGVPEVDTDTPVVDDTGIDDTGIEPVDADGDGFFAEDDCDDSDATINPGADELCDGVDNDCDGTIDYSAVDALVWYGDVDRDGFGDDSRYTLSCVQPPDTTLVGGDCDDDNPDINPGADELCDGVDNDCDASTSEAGRVTFYDDDRGTYTDETALFESGTFSTPLEYTIAREGVLTLCGGEWFASLVIDAPAEVVGFGGADKNVLNGARDVRLVEVEEDVLLRDVTLTLGQTSTSSSSTSQNKGGALYCDSGAEITLDGVVISKSEAYQGGAMHLEGCSAEVYNSEITENEAIQGGAISMGSGSLYLENTLISDNSASYYGGAFFLQVTSSSSSATNLSLVDTLVSDNTSGYYASALYAYPYYRSTGINISCERTRSGTQGGFQGNDDGYTTTYSGAIYLMNYYGGITFTSSSCDFGAEGSSKDNNPNDVTVYGSYPPAQYSFGDGASFTCSGTTCG